MRACVVALEDLSARLDQHGLGKSLNPPGRSQCREHLVVFGRSKTTVTEGRIHHVRERLAESRECVDEGCHESHSGEGLRH